MSATITPITGHPHHDRPQERVPQEPNPDTQALEEQICGLASHIAKFTCRFLELLAAFDEAGGWQRRGFLSPSQWLSWRCGMTETTAREHIRVARALPDLPLIRADFRTGLLSYSKVRALTRVAAAETEQELLTIARGASASQLDRFISGLRRAGELDEIEDAHQRRRVTWRVAEDGEVHLTARLSPEDGAVVIDALQATQEYLQTTDPDRPHGRGSDESTGVSPDDEDHRRTLADALVQICIEGPLTDSAEPAHGSRRAEAVVHATIEQLAQVGPATKGIGSARLELGPALHPDAARRLTCDTGLILHLHDGDATYNVVPSTHPGRTIDVGRRTRTPNASLMRALWARDQGCRYPCCGRRRFVHAHHVVHWAHGGPTTLDNLVLLCGQHHRLLHEGGFSLSMLDGDVQVIDAGGSPISPSGESPGVTSRESKGMPEGVPAMASDDAEGTVPTTDAAADADALSPINGGPMDLKWAVSVVADRWELRRARAASEPADPGTAA